MEDQVKLKLAIASTTKEIKTIILNLLKDEPINWYLRDGYLRYRNDIIIIDPNTHIKCPAEITFSWFSIYDWKISTRAKKIKKNLQTIELLNVRNLSLKILKSVDCILLLDRIDDRPAIDDLENYEIEFKVRSYQPRTNLICFKEADIAMAFKLKWM